MKTSAVLASMLFGSFAVAAPLDKRALAIKTEVVTEVVVVYTTVFDDEVPAATTTPAGYFYEQPQKPSSAAAQPTPAAPAPEPEKPKVSSAPAPQVPTPAPAPSPSPAPVEQPKPVESPKPVEQPKPVESPKPVEQPAPAPSPSAAAAPSNPGGNTGGSTGGATYQDVDMTIYDNQGDYGACGTKLYDTDMIVALSQGAWGQSTYDRMTGAATNPWCGQKIKVEYNGKSVEATIMDLCPGCTGKNDVDLSLAAWNKLTDSAPKGRVKASWSKIN